MHHIAYIIYGVRQGGILSPRLFALYVNQLTDGLLSCNAGCYINDVCINHVMYADDICLLAPSASAMQSLFDVCYDYGSDNDILFNPTELAALELIDRLLAQLKNHMIPINFHLDLAKAFDSLNHDILLDKLSYYGVNGTAKTLLKSYLSDRKQYVKIDEVKSSIQTIKTGVPQGSIVGPLIF